VNKKIQAMKKRLDRLATGLEEDEKVLFARSLAATPDERWRMHENFLRSLKKDMAHLPLLRKTAELNAKTKK